MRLALLVFVAFAAIQAQPPDAAWQRLSTLPEGAAVRVHQRNREVISGRLVRWTPDQLVLRQAAVARPEIVKVSRRSRLRGALLGFAIGFGIAAPIGAYAGPYIADWGNPSLRHAAGWGIFFGGVGAGLGALAGRHPTVYRAP
jgi:hypothetical protein